MSNIQLLITLHTLSIKCLLICVQACTQLFIYNIYNVTIFLYYEYTCMAMGAGGGGGTKEGRTNILYIL